MECHHHEMPVVAGPLKCLKRKYWRKRPNNKNHSSGNEAQEMRIKNLGDSVSPDSVAMLSAGLIGVNECYAG